MILGSGRGGIVLVGGGGGRNYPPGLLMKNSALSTELSCMRLVTGDDLECVKTYFYT